METPHPAGDYKFCFDNRISLFNRKTVFFELLIEDPDNSVSGGELKIFLVNLNSKIIFKVIRRFPFLTDLHRKSFTR